MRFPGRLVIACSLFPALFPVAPLAGQDRAKAPPSLRLERVEVLPARPAPDTLCKLRVRVRNAGTETASRLAFSVRINGGRLPVYENLLYLQAVAPGATAEVPLYNFWSTETSRPLAKDGKLAVEVELRRAEWVKQERDAKGIETWTPLGGVPGLPAALSLTLPMDTKPGPALAPATPATPAIAAGGPQAEPRPPGPKWFTEVASSSGIDFVHHKTVFDERLAKINLWMASIHAGVAAADYDHDGDVDFYLLDSLAGQPNALYRNEGGFRFVDVAAGSGVAAANDREGVSMDSVFADFDNDGDQDLYVAAYGRSRLFRQQDGRFTEAGRQAGVAQRGNSAVAQVLDYDGDGWLDLMVGNYFDNHDLWNIETTRVLQTTFEYARNGGPDLLYHNNGNGTFSEVGKQLGMDDTGWGLDIGSGDLDGDGDTDVYLANDYGPDVVYRNNGDGTFADVTAEATGGDRFAGMNVDLGDYDNDGDLDVYVTNITNGIMHQGNMLWVNEGELVFRNVARETGTSDGGWGWAGKFLDFDNDGDLDIFTVNGYVSNGPIDIMRGPGQPLQGDVSDARMWPDMRHVSLSGYEKSRLFRNDGGTFGEVAAQAGVDSDRDGRGIALADVEGDGDLDMLVSNCGQAPELYRNEVGSSRSWLEVELIGSVKNRDAVGARLTLTAKGRRQVREVDGGNGYSSQSSRVVHFGLADGERIDELEIRWPGGKRQVFRDPAPRTKLLVVE